MHALTRRAWCYVALAGLPLWAEACSRSYGTDETPGANDGGLVTSGDAAGSDAPVDGCATLYVTTEGSDAHDGCRPERALKTIGAALSLLAGDTSKEIHVCRGVYAEGPLVARRSFIVRGGYNCATWERDPTFGTLTIDPNATTVAMRQGALAEDTWTVDLTTAAADAGVSDSGADAALDAGASTADATTSAFTLEGLTLEGPSEPGQVHSHALHVTGGEGTVHANYIKGGRAAASDGSPATIAVLLERTNTKVLGNLIEGGQGVNLGGGAGSLGIYANGGVPQIDGNKISRCLGTGTIGAAGVFAVRGQAGVEIAITNNDVEMGPGIVSGGAQGGTPAVGIVGGVGGTYRIEGNRVHPGATLPSSTNEPAGDVGYTLQGVLIDHAAAARVLNNRIDVGNMNTGRRAHFHSIAVFDVPTSVLVAQNVLVAGGYGGTFANVGYRDGVAVFSHDVNVLGNTLFFPGTSPVPGLPTSYDPRGSIVFSTTQEASGAGDGSGVARGNLIIGVGGTAAAVFGHECIKPLSYVMQDNVSIGSAQANVHSAAGDCASQLALSWEQVNGTSSNSGNAAPPANQGLANYVAAVGPFLEGWDDTYTFDKIRALVLNGAFRPRVSVSCMYLKAVGAEPLMPALDISSAPRTLSFTPGAWEQDTCVP